MIFGRRTDSSCPVCLAVDNPHCQHGAQAKSLAGLISGRWCFGAGPLASGQTLVGTLPTDVSAPLLVLLARGNVGLAAVMNAVNTAIPPFVVPALFLAPTGVELQVPVGP